MTASAQIAVRHFGRKTVAVLSCKGITILGLQALPAAEFASCDTGYKVNDNGTGRVWTFADVMRAAT